MAGKPGGQSNNAHLVNPGLGEMLSLVDSDSAGDLMIKRCYYLPMSNCW